MFQDIAGWWWPISNDVMYGNPLPYGSETKSAVYLFGADSNILRIALTTKISKIYQIQEDINSNIYYRIIIFYV